MKFIIIQRGFETLHVISVSEIMMIDMQELDLSIILKNGLHYHANLIYFTHEPSSLDKFRMNLCDFLRNEDKKTFEIATIPTVKEQEKNRLKHKIEPDFKF